MRKSIILLGLFLINSFLVVSQQNNVVLELFTSQGCSSCPSADNLLREIISDNQNSNIIALAYHVDYWNRLGWRDPFSKANYSNYQRDYGKKFGGRSIYTPQLVINGNTHVVGSDKRALNNQLLKLNSKKLQIPITITSVIKRGKNIELKYNLEKTLGNYRVNTAMLLKEHSTNVKRGENRNRKLIEANIVMDKKITSTEDKPVIVFENVDYNLEELSFVVYVQKTNLEVVGSNQWRP